MFAKLFFNWYYFIKSSCGQKSQSTLQAIIAVIAI